MQRWTDEPNDEIVVVSVEPVAREPNVVGEPGLPKAPRERAVLAEHALLVFRRQPLKAFRALQRIPHRPDIRRIEQAAKRAPV